MSLFIEKETDTDFSFDEEALAKEVTDYAIEHEGFPLEAEINLTLTDNDESTPSIKNTVTLMRRRTFCHFRCFLMRAQEIFRN